MIHRYTLIKAAKIIKQWHDFSFREQMGDDPDPLAFRIYYEHSPEMKSIREALGPYDEIKDEVISATSISRKNETK